MIFFWLYTMALRKMLPRCKEEAILSSHSVLNKHLISAKFHFIVLLHCCWVVNFFPSLCRRKQQIRNIFMCLFFTSNCSSFPLTWGFFMQIHNGFFSIMFFSAISRMLYLRSTKNYVKIPSLKTVNKKEHRKNTSQLHLWIFLSNSVKRIDLLDYNNGNSSFREAQGGVCFN